MMTMLNASVLQDLKALYKQPNSQELENENLLLVNLIFDPNFYKKAVCTEDDFRLGNNKTIFLALETLKNENYPANGELLIQELERITKLNLANLKEIFPVQANYSLLEVRTQNKRAKIKSLAQECESMTAEELDEETHRIAQKHLKQAHAEVVDAQKYAAKGYPDYLNQRKAHELGFYSGRPNFDEFTGLERGQLVTLAARPSIGKSAFALNLAYEWACYGFNIYYISLEMSPQQLMARLCARVSKGLFHEPISATKFKYGNVPEDYYAKVNEELQKMTGKIEFAYLPSVNHQKALNMAAEKNPDIVIIDHVDLMPIDKRKNESSAIGEITSAFKGFAGEKKCLLFMVSQLNRDGDGKMPELKDLRSSGAKEQDSDIVIFLHRDRDPDADDKTTVLRVAKNRDGKVGDVLMEFDPRTTFFREMH